MPMSRYEIRNEFSLADPDLYRAAHKDDPAALLEGLAMAGLVGVLRQLGDLAEFAAEIFHDLHGEVLATAARGNDLMIRAQQLEAEVPSIEKASLSQTDHYSFYNNAGVHWHPKPQKSQNLVTKSDLPRFVMDIYEECRGPPRLFLLDKFDVAGAGACLKRYTDPSCYKVEMSAMSNTNVHRERQFRKAKKKGPRGRNGQTPEVQPISQANVHQFILDEPVENGVGNPVRLVKLKRRLHFSPFDSITGRSYMEKFSKSPSLEHQQLVEITEVPRPRSLSPTGECVETKEILYLYREQNIQNLFEMDDVTSDDKVYEVYNNVADGYLSTFSKDTGEKDIAVNGESKIEGYFTSYQSDEVASEMDNFVDAPSTMDSEMDTGSELKVNKDFTPAFINSQIENQAKHLHSLPSGDSTMSDDANSSSRKEMPKFLSSGSPITTGTSDSHSRELYIEGNESADVPESVVVDDEAVTEKTIYEFQVEQLSKQGGFGDTCVEKDAVTKDRSDFEKQIPKSDETTITLDDEGKKINNTMDVLCSPSISGSNSLPGNDSPRSFSGEHLVDEPNCENEHFMSFMCNAVGQTFGNFDAIPNYLVREDDYDHKDLSQFEKTESMLNIHHDISHNIVDNAKMNNSENPLPGKSDDELPTLTEKFPSDVTDITHKGEGLASKPSKVEMLINRLDNEATNGGSDASNNSSCTMEASPGKKFSETPLAKDEIVDTEDHHSDRSIKRQIISGTLVSLSAENSPGWEETAPDAHGKDFIPRENTPKNNTFKVGTREYCEVIELHEMRLSDKVTLTPNGVVSMGSPSCVLEYLGNPTVTSDIIAHDNPDKDFIGLEERETSGYEDTESPVEMQDLLGINYSMEDRSNDGVMTSPVLSDYDNVLIANVETPLDLGNMDKAYAICSRLGEFGDEKKSLFGSLLQESSFVKDDSGYLSETCTELDLMEENCTKEAAASDVFYLVANVSNLHSECISNCTDTQSPNEHKCGFGTYQEIFQKSGIYNKVCDATSLPINPDAAKTVSEKIEIPLANQISAQLPESGERDSDSLSQMPINHQKLLDLDVSVSVLPEPRNHDIDVPGYRKDQLGVIFPQGNIVTTNQINLDEVPPLPPLPPVEWRKGRLQHASSITEGEITKPVGLFLHDASTGDISYSLEKTDHVLCSDAAEKLLNEQKIGQLLPVYKTIDILPKIDEKQQEPFIPDLNTGEVTSPSEEGDVANEFRTVKHRPPNPLIESIAILDKSKLHKVTELVRPEIREADGRESLLEQIKTKSFNLRPTLASRLTIKGPQTNPKVAAILERVDAIREAFVGSDEDEEDSWSDP